MTHQTSHSGGTPPLFPPAAAAAIREHRDVRSSEESTGGGGRPSRARAREQESGDAESALNRAGGGGFAFDKPSLARCAEGNGSSPAVVVPAEVLPALCGSGVAGTDLPTAQGPPPPACHDFAVAAERLRDAIFASDVVAGDVQKALEPFREGDLL